MKLPHSIGRRISTIKKYRYRWVFFIALIWTAIDVFLWTRYMQMPFDAKYDSSFQVLNPLAVWMRVAIVFYMSIVMGYLLVFRLKQMFRDYPIIANLILKTAILLLASIFMNFLVHFSYGLIILNVSIPQALYNFYADSSYTPWFWSNNINWMIIFIITQIFIEINEKYSPGIFLDIMLGKYIKPRIEKRIVMFLDLNDSTTIAESLGHMIYFRFIRDFIFYVSTALLEYNGRIYQYVGDEVVVSWMYSEKNVQKCMQALLEARKMLQRHADNFKKRYGQVPEFKVGIHIGEVTVGEIGVLKRDLAMSGDTMNTAARMRTACTELNRKFIVSWDFIDALKLKDWQYESMGHIELKGKSNDIELFALKI